MPRLIVEKGPEKGKSAAVQKTGVLVVGRDAQAHLRINDSMCSRLHFRIEQGPDGFRVVDLESMNGTFVNGDRIRQPTPVRVGDTIQIGDTLFSVLQDSESGDPLIGQKLGGYVILGRLGRGGMGVVYKAEQKDLQRLVALKVITEENFRDKGSREVLVNEARAAAQLNHPNVVQVYDIKKEPASGIYYFSMEFMTGGSVQDLLLREKKIPAETAVRMILDAARGLEYAERKGILHRDIKPDNLMIGETGVVKLGDLGLARRAAEEVKPEERDVVIGTPHYIAPEQVLGEKSDHRGDIYSLGATLYRMIGGRTPYTGGSVKEIVTRKVKSDPTPLRELDPEIPAQVEAIVQRMMARNPAERHQTVTEVIADLEDFLQGAPPAEAVPPWRRPAVVGGVLGALALALAAALFVRSQQSSEPAPPVAGGGGTSPPPVVDPGGNADATIEATGNLRFAQAEDDERKVVASNPATIRTAIASYRKVLDEAATSSFAARARQKIEHLEGMIRGADAVDAFAHAEKTDRDVWAAFAAAVPKGAASPAAVKPVLDAYGAVAGTYPSTKQAEEATKREKHVRLWLDRWQAMLGQFETARAEARRKADGREYRDALDGLNSFGESCRRAALAESPVPDRWRDLLLDKRAQAEGGAIMQEARKAFDEIKAKAEALVAARKYDEARAALEPVTQTFRLASLVQEAGEIQETIRRKILELVQEEQRKQALAREKALGEDAATYAAAEKKSAEARDRFDFEAAAQAFRSADLKTPLAQRVRDRRVALLGQIQGFHAAFRQRLAAFLKNNTGAPIMINPGIGLGQVTEVTDEGVTIKIQGGKVLQLWSKFSPKDLGAQLIRRAWKPMDADACLSLALFYRVFDLRLDTAAAAEEGLALLEKDREEQVKKGAAPEDRLTLEAKLHDVSDEARKSSGSLDQEDEAELRLARGQELVRAKEGSRARQELDPLAAGPLAKTRCVADNAERIRRLLEEARK